MNLFLSQAEFFGEALSLSSMALAKEDVVDGQCDHAGGECEYEFFVGEEAFFGDFGIAEDEVDFGDGGVDEGGGGEGLEEVFTDGENDG